MGSRVLTLRNTDETRTHNRLYILHDAAALQFDYRIAREAPDNLDVFIGDELIGGIHLNVDGDPNFTRQYAIEQFSIPVSVRGTVETIHFTLDPLGQMAVSQINIDNVVFLPEPGSLGAWLIATALVAHRRRGQGR